MPTKPETRTTSDLVVDVRDEANVYAAVDQALATFGVTAALEIANAREVFVNLAPVSFPELLLQLRGIFRDRIEHARSLPNV